MIREYTENRRRNLRDYAGWIAICINCLFFFYFFTHVNFTDRRRHVYVEANIIIIMIRGGYVMVIIFVRRKI
jgi:hypothetical protein